MFVSLCLHNLKHLCVFSVNANFLLLRECICAPVWESLCASILVCVCVCVAGWNVHFDSPGGKRGNKWERCINPRFRIGASGMLRVSSFHSDTVTTNGISMGLHLEL